MEDQTLFAATNSIATAKEFQEHIATAPYESREMLAYEALSVMGDPDTFFNQKRIFVHALGARVIAGSELTSIDEELLDGKQFWDVYFKAYFERFSYVHSPLLSSICMRVVEAEVVRSNSDPHFEGKVIKSGVYIPVHAVESVIAA